MFTANQIPILHADRPQAARLALVMVGLPARGKTHVARRVAKYLRWLGYHTEVFNVGNTRRQELGSQKLSEFFDPQNRDATEQRGHVAAITLDQMVAWFQSGGEVGVYDATNSTKERRFFVGEVLRSNGIHCVFVESICDDESVIEANIREVKLNMPDYAGVSPDEAARDFRARIAHYQSVYQTVSDDEGSYIKIFDVGKRIEAHQIQGFLPSKIASFLINLHPLKRPILLTRHGESSFNQEGRIGGDPSLSPRGQAYALRLQNFVEVERRFDFLSVWTSTLERTRDTAKPLASAPVPWRALDEIDAGVYEGLTYEEIRQRDPEGALARERDKFFYRYPQGESYRDVIRRIEPVIVELERERDPILVISHQAVIRALLAYLKDQRPEECPNLEIPLHTIFELVPATYGCEQRIHTIGP